MSTAAPTFDVKQTARVSFSALVRVEMRKSIDTRSGFWLLAVIAAITAVVMTIVILAVDEPTAGMFMAGAMTPQGFLLPVLGILLVTSEWSQRTAMTTFTLEPSRGRVMAAKTVAATVWAILAYVVLVALAALFAVLSGTENAFEGVDWTLIAVFALLQVITIWQGVGYGMLFQSSPVAIVVFFAAPIVMSMLFNLVSWLRDIAPWVDLGTAQEALFSFGADGLELTAEDWAHLGTTFLIWILVPFVLGWIRTMRSEIK